GEPQQQAGPAVSAGREGAAALRGPLPGAGGAAGVVGLRAEAARPRGAPLTAGEAAGARGARATAAAPARAAAAATARAAAAGTTRAAVELARVQLARIGSPVRRPGVCSAVGAARPGVGARRTSGRAARAPRPARPTAAARAGATRAGQGRGRPRQQRDGVVAGSPLQRSGGGAGGAARVAQDVAIDGDGRAVVVLDPLLGDRARADEVAGDER